MIMVKGFFFFKVNFFWDVVVSKIIKFIILWKLIDLKVK